MNHSDQLDDPQWAAYYDWRVKNGKPDSRSNREAFKAGWLALAAFDERAAVNLYCWPDEAKP